MLDTNHLQTPSFVYDSGELIAGAWRAREAIADPEVRLLFAMKALSFDACLAELASHLDGLHASSLFEAQLARTILGERGIIHYTSPALRPDEAGAIVRECDLVSFNSLGQWERRPRVLGRTSYGLRVNPQRSFVDDERYDPCRRHSKLGVPLDALAAVLTTAPDRLEGLDGILVHSNCEAGDFAMLATTIEHLIARIGPLLARLKWINLGGGYSFAPGVDPTPLRDTVRLLRERYRLRVLLEPGWAIAERAGSLVATVVDLFESEGRTIAVLDASVNHLPECFEYAAPPRVAGTVAGGAHRAVLAGATCLAGDLFGTYDFAAPLALGMRIVFEHVGAYSLVKAHMFNGVNLPAIYLRSPSGALTLARQFTYADFLARCQAVAHAPH